MTALCVQPPPMSSLPHCQVLLDERVMTRAVRHSKAAPVADAVHELELSGALCGARAFGAKVGELPQRARRAGCKSVTSAVSGVASGVVLSVCNTSGSPSFQSVYNCHSQTSSPKVKR